MLATCCDIPQLNFLSLQTIVLFFISHFGLLAFHDARRNVQ